MLNKVLLISLIFLIPINGCDAKNIDQEEEIDYSKYINWEAWIRDEVMQIHFETDTCIRQCNIGLNSCYEFSCYSECSLMHDREITSLTHEVSSEGIRIKDIIISANIGKYKTYISENDDMFVTSVGNEKIYDMVENNQNEKPKQYIDCLVDCGDGNCFKSSCVNNCVSILS
jgi:hypothetical protein